MSHRVTLRLVLVASMALAALSAACADSSAPEDNKPRFTSKEEHFSIHELPGWTVGRDRGTTTFRSPSGTTVIAVRGVAFEGDWSEPRVPDVVLPAVEKVLHGLPEARVTGPTREADASLTAWSYDATFVPQDRGDRVWRRHVVAWGQTRVFHILITTSDGRLGVFEAAAFDAVLRSLREEA